MHATVGVARGGRLAARARSGTQAAVSAVVAALTTGDDLAAGLAASAEAIALAESACCVEIWSGATPDALTRTAAWRDGRPVAAPYAAADPAERPDLTAVCNGEQVVEWRTGAGLPEAAAALLERHAATRSRTHGLHAGARTVGALTVVQAGPTAKATAAERHRLTVMAQLLAGVVRSAGAAQTGDAATARAAALRAAARAVAASLESDQAVEAVEAQIAAVVGGRGCRVRVYLRGDQGAYTQFPPRSPDGGEDLETDALTDLEQRAVDERRTHCTAAAGAVRLASPLLLRGTPLGYLTLIAARPEPLTAAEVDAIETLGQHIVTALDIARLRRSVQRLTTIDTLTGLRNREFLFERMAAEIARAQRYKEPLSLTFIDVDDFTRFNARHGNREGNRLLRATANLVRMSVREQVDVACRYGGAQFAVLLPNTRAAANGAGIVAERIRRQIESTRFHDENDNRLERVTVSLGVAGYPVHADDGEDLVALAAEALDAAKAAGKNRVGLYTVRR
jgi:diguanylate cyclase (GGDEF)-like protein